MSIAIWSSARGAATIEHFAYLGALDLHYSVNASIPPRQDESLATLSPARNHPVVAHAIVRCLVFVLVLAVLSGGIVGKARAAGGNDLICGVGNTACDEGIASHRCRTNLAAHIAENGGTGIECRKYPNRYAMKHVGTEYSVNPNNYPNDYYYSGTCSARPSQAQGAALPNGALQCIDGCEYSHQSSGIGPGTAVPSGNLCQIPPFDPGKNNQCDVSTGPVSVGNPINAFVGSKTESIYDYVDSGGHLNLSRHYASIVAPSNPGSTLGNRWRHNYQASLVSTSLGRRLNRPNGNSYLFKKIGAEWKSDADVGDRLLAVSNAGQLVGWRVTTPDNQIEHLDVQGRLNRIEYPDGDILQMTYDGSGRLSRVSDRRERALTFTYASSFLDTVTLPDGILLKYVYDAQRLSGVSYQINADGTTQFTSLQYRYEDASDPQLLTGVIDESNQRYASWTYDRIGRAVSSKHGDPNGGIDRVSLVYGPSQSWVTNALGETVELGYQHQLGRAKLASAQKLCAGCSGSSFQTRAYDANGYPDGFTDFTGSATDHDYNARGLLTQKVEAANDTAGKKRSTQTDWHSSLAVPTERRSYDAGNVLVAKSTWTYNARGQALTSSQIDPATSVTRTSTMTYCEQSGIDAGTCPLLGLITSVDGPRIDVSDLTTYTYYPSDDPACASAPTTCPHRKGDLWKVTNALGQVAETLRYDGAGRVLSVKDPSGVITDMEYHPRGWLAARKVRGTDDGSEADDAITRIEYEPTGLVSKVIQPDGAFTAYTYDAAHRLTAIEDNSGNRIAYTLDNAGNRIKEDTQDGGSTLRRTLSRVYNQLGQLQTAADAYDNPTDFAYDANGNTDTATDALGRVTDNDYDPLNRLSRTLQDVAGIRAETKFQYDALDNLTQVTDPKGLNTQYQYNGLGDLLQLDSPDTGVSLYTYDSAGNRKTSTDARGEPATYTYDALNRLTGIGYSDPALNVTYTYDANQAVCEAGETFAIGRLTRLDDGSGSTQYCYDRRGNLVRKAQTTNGQVFAVRYAYTKAGRIASVTYPSGTRVDYAHNALGQPSAVSVTPAGGTTEALLSNVTYHPFGPVAEIEYGGGRRLKRTLNQNYQPDTIEDTATDGLSLGFGFDAVGNLTALRTPAQSGAPIETFGYDALSRLTDVRDGPTGVAIEQYAYDATGNRMGVTTAAGATAYQYPAESHRLAAVGTESRVYDAAGNTTAIGGTVREFGYSAAGRMSQAKQAGSVVMNYAYNGRGEQVRRYPATTSAAQTYAFYDEAGRLLGRYDNTGSRVQEVIWLDDLPVGVIASNQLHYVQADHLGTPRAIIDPTREKAVWKWDLAGEAFGKTVPNENPDGDAALFSFDLRFPGQQYDAATGLNYNYFRDYSSDTGRYVQSDPISLASDISTYRYAETNPGIFADRLGLFGEVLNDRFPMPWDPQRCAEILRQIQTKRREIGQRFADLDRNSGSLPNAVRGPLRADRMGHITIINILDSQARKLEDDYDRHCRGPGPNCPVPFSTPANAEDPASSPQTAPAAGIGTILLMMLVGYLALST